MESKVDAEWAQGLPFPTGSEMREFCCPARWCQSVRGLNLNSEWCLSGPGMSFQTCDKYGTKADCWAKYDKEFI